MKKKYFLGMLTLAAVALSASFVSCSSDDGDGSGGGDVNKTIPETTPKDADGNYIRLTSIKGGYDGDINFTYDASGKLTGWKSGDWLNVTVSGNKITCIGDSEWGDGWEKEVMEYTVTLNSDGLISALSFNQREEIKNKGEEPEIVTSTGTLNFSYNSQKQLIKTTGSSTTQHEEYGEKWSYKSTGTEIYTWSDGNLIKVESVSKSDADDPEYGGEITTITTYTYGSQVNTSKQYPSGLGEAIIGGDYMALGYLGYFGVGPAYLPTGYSEEYTESYAGEEPYESHHDYTLSYTLNADGTIATEKISSGSYTQKTLTYSYTTVSGDGDDDDDDVVSGSAKDFVGTWMIEYEKNSSGIVYQVEDGENGSWFIFTADGKGYEEDHYPGETERWPIKWSYNAKEKTLTVIDVEDPADTDTDIYEVVSISGSKMVLRIYGEEFGFVKVK